MVSQQRIFAFSKLGDFLRTYVEYENKNLSDLSNDNETYLDFKKSLTKVTQQNPWFTEDNLLFCFETWSQILTVDSLTDWTNQYTSKKHSKKKIGLTLAGNIPMVGFHDILCVLFSDNIALIKLSSKDAILIPFLLKIATNFDASLTDDVIFTERLLDFDAIIATGSNNTARYFEHYFGKYPHIIRKNRTSVAILDGNESVEDLNHLSHDIFRYYGLGCRSVTKLYLPENYDTDKIFHALFPWKEIVNQNKYGNNYDYQKAVNLMSNLPFLDNGFLILKENQLLQTPIGVVHFSYYEDENTLQKELFKEKDNLQCIVGNLKEICNIPFGESQKPTLSDYADGIDTFQFLMDL